MYCTIFAVRMEYRVSYCMYVVWLALLGEYYRVMNGMFLGFTVSYLSYVNAVWMHAGMGVGCSK